MLTHCAYTRTHSHAHALRQYASRAKRIKTNAIVNEDTNDRIIRELRAEIERLRKEVAGQKMPAQV